MVDREPYWTGAEAVNMQIRVLIVDDSENDALLLADELRRNGYHPTWMCVDDPEAMEQALTEERWDIIIADYTIPGFGGPEALKVLQDTGLDIPFILVSGTTAEHTCVDVMRSGAQDFIYKHSLYRLAPAVKRELADAETRGKRRQAEEKAAMLAAIVESSEDAIIGKTLDGVITSWNHGAEKMYGYAADEVLGQLFEIIVPPDRHDESMMLIETVRRGEAVSRLDTERLTKEGNRLYVAMSVSPIKDRDDRIVGVSTNSRDITELKRAEQREHEIEVHKREFYRRTISAFTEGKLVIVEPEEITEIAGDPVASWEIVGVEALTTIRDSVKGLMLNVGVGERRAYDFIGPIVEAVTNALKHARGGRASLHVDSERAIFVISDNGPGIEALALPDVALTRGYSTTSTLGMGYTIMIASADRVYLATGPSGTTVAIEMNLQNGLNEGDALARKLPGW